MSTALDGSLALLETASQEADRGWPLWVWILIVAGALALIVAVVAIAAYPRDGSF